MKKHEWNKEVGEYNRQKKRLKVRGEVKRTYFLKITTDKYLEKEVKKGTATGKGKVLDKIVDSIQANEK